MRPPFTSLSEAADDYDTTCVSVRTRDLTLTAEQEKLLDRYTAVVDFMAGATAAVQIILNSKSKDQLGELLDELNGFADYMKEKWGTKGTKALSNELLIKRLRHFAEAYPTDLWPPLTADERAIVGAELVSRISAHMARHNSKLMLEAAQALADAEQEERDNCALIQKLGGLLSQSVDICAARPARFSYGELDDVPALCSMMVKHNARLGLYAKLTQNTLAMLADSARMMLEIHEMEDGRATKERGTDTEQEAGAAQGDVPREVVSADARPPA